MQNIVLIVEKLSKRTANKITLKGIVMTLKFYTLLTLLFIVVLGNLVYFFITNQSVALDIFDTHFASYPVAIWVTIPFVIYYILNVLLMSFGSVQAYFRVRNYDRDYEKLQGQFRNVILQNGKKTEYKTARYKKLGAFLNTCTLVPKDNAFVEGDKKINGLFSTIDALKAGEIVDLKSYALEDNNPLVIQNMKNILAKDSHKAEKIVAKASNYSQDFVQEAFTILCGYASVSTIGKYKEYMSLESFLVILGRLNSENENSSAKIELSIDDIIEFIKIAHCSEDDYLHIARELKTILIPDERIHLFENISHNDEKAVRAHIYTYVDLEMLDKAKELLENYENQDYPIIRAYMALKSHNYTCNIDTLIAG